MKRLIDVSFYQGTINWEEVKKHIDGAIIKIGYGMDLKNQDDKCFKRNADECTRLGIPFGVYIYSYANTVEKARSEAEHVLRMIKGYKLSYPVYLDLEADIQKNINKKLLGTIAQTFCTKIKQAGYYPAIYASKYWFESILTDSIFNNYDKWVAQYASKCTYKKNYAMWQYSDKGKIDGIIGYVDLDYCYKDYPAIINGRVPVVVTVEPEEVHSNSYKVKVMASVLNVRKGAGTGYPVVTTVKKGEVYTIVEEINGWGRLKSGAGWISMNYVKKI